jgi:hypothetical protein
MAAPTNAAKREKSSCQLGAVHTWHLADLGVPAYVRFAPDALPTETSPEPRKETAPAKGDKLGPKFTGRKVPHVDPIKFCFRKPQSLENQEWRAVLSPLRETVFGY